MNLDEAKKKFIHSWGNLAVDWGVNKAMGQVHGLLIISDKPICTNMMMELLHLSRGAVNMSVNSLLDWDLIHKVHIEGERKDFFRAEKDPFKMFVAVLEHRKRKELDPLLKVLCEVRNVEGNCEQCTNIKNIVDDIYNFTKIADTAIQRLTQTDSRWLTSTFSKNL